MTAFNHPPSPHDARPPDWDPVRAEEMVHRQLERRDVRDPYVLEAMRRVPRSAFMPPGEDPYADAPAPIGEGQTISQPYVVARMTELLGVRPAVPAMRVLEIGVGSGYQTAVLARLGAEVYGIGRHAPLLARARESLARAGLLGRVHLHHGDGTRGWPEPMTFDRILAAAGAPEVPTKLLMAQLKDGGRAVMPVGPMDLQRLVLIDRRGDELRTTALDAVRFVPLIGAEGWGEQ